ncbi:MAG: 16S rRNA (guanine(527)-N(7))-methyltransferase RsmG [Phycisphaerae bacterium]|nr:16S rRNA (guanine(527)-N(7))-methyltransferase RsmG [Phycisphaerae bacterium]
MTQAELKAAGFDVSDAGQALLADFVHYLLEENENLNLTAADDQRTVWRVHICDSLALLPVVRVFDAARVLDLGSGGGLPGLPLACVCEQADVILLDATQKKVAALERIIARLELSNARAVWGRAETLAHRSAYREQFDLVTARAVASLPVLIEYAAGFTRTGGYCWFFKSAPRADAERAQAESAARACGLVCAETVPYRLPGDEDERVLVGYRKEGALGEHLPRPIGRAKKRPL